MWSSQSVYVWASHARLSILPENVIRRSGPSSRHSSYVNTVTLAFVVITSSANCIHPFLVRDPKSYRTCIKCLLGFRAPDITHLFPDSNHLFLGPNDKFAQWTPYVKRWRQMIMSTCSLRREQVSVRPERTMFESSGPTCTRRKLKDRRRQSLLR
ncbi:hypothetical protein J6590_001895 [Homalodisca vitripennis]|nr:hypothetical protein J6590_001895 [Homalodisca vitripennis]